jgi:hypothetical protein
MFKLLQLYDWHCRNSQCVNFSLICCLVVPNRHLCQSLGKGKRRLPWIHKTISFRGSSQLCSHQCNLLEQRSIKSKLRQQKTENCRFLNPYLLEIQQTMWVLQFEVTLINEALDQAKIESGWLELDENFQIWLQKMDCRFGVLDVLLIVWIAIVGLWLELMAVEWSKGSKAIVCGMKIGFFFCANS